VKLYLSRTMPQPADMNFNAASVDGIRRFVYQTNGHAFVLFTSHNALRSCADALKVPFLIKGWKLLVQGGDLTRNQMLNEFRDDVDSVLFGTDSFWTGVDVPGEALSNVILTRLPFASPGHPLIAGRMQRIEAQGRSSFSEYSLPEAVLKFRQGAGRLIRSRTDRGVIVLLDRRVITKSYGRMFLESLPYKVIKE
ncbi:MAG: ATP-dependent DNA helicase, partial [Lentisphaeria bacterium]|nr:ATP-dependent DNA helicase [Lentisphaeria bacterium]